jgi:hypothetical protein
VRDVGAARRLGDAEGDDLLALDRGRQPALPLRVGPEAADRRRRDRNVRPDAGGDAARAAASQLFEEDGFVDDAGPRATVRLVVLEPQQVQGRETREELPRKLPLRLPVVDVGPDFLLDELADRAPKLFVLGAEEVRTRRSYVCQ